MWSSTNGWNESSIPDQTGKVVIVTGGNSGIGWQAARALADHGATVVLACRSAARGAEAADKLKAFVPDAKVDVQPLDLASLASVRAFAESFLRSYERLDVLCNNAGVMAIPRQTTAEGFEMQLGTNHLGHFALTGLLFESLKKTEHSRVVNVSSLAHGMGRMSWDDLQGERSYSKWPAYGQSKLANLLFTYELQRRVSAKKIDVAAIACHPGYAATNLQFVGPRQEGSKLMEKLSRWANNNVAQSAEMGALPTLFAAVSNGARGGDFIGPSGFNALWGPPVIVEPRPHARNADDARKLWEVSVELTNVDFGGL
ncbi:MAG: oxidoreductase [Polyangiaceae bacterium]